MKRHVTVTSPSADCSVYAPPSEPNFIKTILMKIFNIQSPLSVIMQLKTSIVHCHGRAMPMQWCKRRCEEHYLQLALYNICAGFHNTTIPKNDNLYVNSQSIYILYKSLKGGVQISINNVFSREQSCPNLCICVHFGLLVCSYILLQ